MPVKSLKERTRPESTEVLYPLDRIVTIDAGMLEELKQGALANPRRRIRLCAHRDVDDRVHEMIIVHTKETYVRPHRHSGKTESFHVIDGLVDVVVFDDGGEVIDVIPMGPAASGLPFFYRIADPLYHTLLIRSDVIVFHEATSGPFRRDESSFATWAPGDDDAAIAVYLADVDRRARDFLSSRS